MRRNSQSHKPLHLINKDKLMNQTQNTMAKTTSKVSYRNHKNYSSGIPLYFRFYIMNNMKSNNIDADNNAEQSEHACKNPGPNVNLQYLPKISHLLLYCISTSGWNCSFQILKYFDQSIN